MWQNRWNRKHVAYSFPVWLTAACMRNRPSPAPRHRGKLTKNLDAQWYNFLGFRPMLLYFLPQLPDFRTTNPFISCRHWLANSTLAPSIILYKNPRKFRLKKKCLLHSFRLYPCYIGFSCQIQLNHSVNPLTPEPPVTARAAWGTCARDAFPPISPTK